MEHYPLGSLLNLPPLSSGPSSGAAISLSLLEVAVQIAKGLTHLHGLSPPVSHGCLHPSNVLISAIQDGRIEVALTDVGLLPSTVAHSVQLKHVEYMAPEALRAYVEEQTPESLLRKAMTPAADVYSFGVLLWEMATRRRPWAGVKVMAAVVHGDTLPIPEGLPEGMKEILRGCFAGVPEEEPGSPPASPPWAGEAESGPSSLPSRGRRVAEGGAKASETPPLGEWRLTSAKVLELLGREVAAATPA